MGIYGENMLVSLAVLERKNAFRCMIHIDENLEIGGRWAYLLG